ncbi:helix-turn-helix domain-containing protein [Luteitalea pratensis]|uniref:helix-turn-helix domain-containing protein n=1 Tax=Luteitalea pratensis TaxID=1855912 RepID=UPI000D735F3F|nr:helix-turn-helix domain-containing protein [Luteitalea pratensis]
MTDSLTRDLPNPCTPRELARALRIHRAVIYRAIHAGALPAVRFSARGDCRLPVDGIERWLQGQVVCANP